LNSPAGSAGNVVEVRHDSRNSTLYAHLQAFAPGMVKGARIGQEIWLDSSAPRAGYRSALALRDQSSRSQVNPLTAELPVPNRLRYRSAPALATVAARLQRASLCSSASASPPARADGRMAAPTPDTSGSISG
jgi:hypothetical protein